MASAPRKRPKSDLRSSNIKPKCNPSSSSSSSSLDFLKKEPPPYLFPSKSEFLRLLAVVAVAVSVATACNYAVSFLSRQPKPFCDSNGDGSEDSLLDFCDPCPSKGKCYQGKLECVPGYRKHGRSCIEDGEINQTAKKISEWMEIRVCEAYAQFLCEGTGIIWVQEPDIWNDLDQNKLFENIGMNNDTFVVAKQKAMVTTRNVLEEGTNLHGIKELKCPEWLAERYKPLICCIKLFISKHALLLVLVSTLLVGLMLIIQRIRWRQYLSIRTEQLYEQVCDILEESAIMAKSGDSKGEPWVVASWLRDHLLLPGERKNPLLWKKVEELVREDSRLDQYPKLVKGESKVVWEWQVEGSLSSSKLKRKEPKSKLKPTEGKNSSSGPESQATKAGDLLYC